MDLQRPSDLLPIQERFVRHDRDTTFAALSCFSCSGVPYPSKSGLDKFGRLEHPQCLQSLQCRRHRRRRRLRPLVGQRPVSAIHLGYFCPVQNERRNNRKVIAHEAAGNQCGLAATEGPFAHTAITTREYEVACHVRARVRYVSYPSTLMRVRQGLGLITHRVLGTRRWRHWPQSAAFSEKGDGRVVLVTIQVSKDASGNSPSRLPKFRDQIRNLPGLLVSHRWVVLRAMRKREVSLHQDERRSCVVDAQFGHLQNPRAPIIICEAGERAF